MPSKVTENAHTGPIAKRQKRGLANGIPVQTQAHRSRIFAPFRTVGLVSPTEVPFTSLPLGKTTFQITTSVGRSLQTYDLKRGLNLVFITRPQTPENITTTIAWKKFVLAAWGGRGPRAERGVWVFQRGKKVDELELPRGMTENITNLTVFGAWIVGACSTRIEVWKSETLEHYTTLQGASSSPLSGGVVSMPTYLNKIFAGRSDGSVEIWNLSTAKLLFTLLPPASDYGAVTALEPTPALSLIAIAYASGPVVIHDVRRDKEIMRLNTGSSTKSPITSMSFRTDGLGAGDDGRRDGVVATASNGSGDVTFWDLNDGGRKMGILHGAHNPPSQDRLGGISKIEFLPGQSIIISSGLDNSLKSWIFDEQPFSPIPRILHARGGFAGSVTKLEFVPSNSDGTDDAGKWLLGSSKDRSLWGWSLRRDGQSTELSQGAIRKKAKKQGLLSNGRGGLEVNSSFEELKSPPITCIACSLNRDGGIGAVPGNHGIWNNASRGKGDKGESSMTGWESIVTAHEGDSKARTWFWGRKRAGRWTFDTSDGAAVSSVAISPCGTFALVGSAKGAIDMYNLQSGAHRQRFPARLTPKQAERLKLQKQQMEDNPFAVAANSPNFYPGEGKHTKGITGIAIDSLNRTVISVSEDGKVKFWDFATSLLLHEIDWYPMTKIKDMRYHRGSDLIALSCDDGSIRVVDIETKKLVRELWNPHGTQTIDYAFSQDGRWIVAGSARQVRVYDLPSGHLIDAMTLPKPCTSIAFSPTGEYLATAQEDEVGINIWTNRALFTHVSTRHISEKEIASINAPTASGEGSEGLIEAAAEEDEEDEEQDKTVAPDIDQLSKQITTLSLVPKARWQTLLHLDTIRARNKPKEAPQKPKVAPFFLPSLNQGGTNPADGEKSLVPTEDANSRITKTSISRGSSTNEFTRLLRLAEQTQDYTPLLSHLASLSPAAADIAIRTLDDTAPYIELLTFIHALTSRLRERRDYELIQAWMSVFLRLHGDSMRDEGLVAALKEFQEEAKVEKQRVGGLVGYAVGVVGWVRSGRA